MKWLLTTAVLVVLLLSAYLLHAHNESRTKKKREAFYELRLQGYAHQFGLGSTRKQIEAQLIASGAQFHQVCCFHQRGSVLPDLVKVGEEKGPWYCSGVWINVAFDFHAVKTHDRLKADDADVLDQVALFREAEGCL